MWLVLAVSIEFDATSHARQYATRKATEQRAVKCTLRPTRRVRPKKVGLLVVQSANRKKSRRQRARRPRVQEPHPKIAPTIILAD